MIDAEKGLQAKQPSFFSSLWWSAQAFIFIAVILLSIRWGTMREPLIAFRWYVVYPGFLGLLIGMYHGHSCSSSPKQPLWSDIFGLTFAFLILLMLSPGQPGQTAEPYVPLRWYTLYPCVLGYVICAYHEKLYSTSSRRPLWWGIAALMFAAPIFSMVPLEWGGVSGAHISFSWYILCPCLVGLVICTNHKSLCRWLYCELEKLRTLLERLSSVLY